MKSHPILFSSPMVRALLDGSKTQTRRVVKPQPAAGQGMVNASYCGHPKLWLRDGACDPADPAKEWHCPYGQPGDQIWVRETWAHGLHAMAANRDEEGPFVYAASDSPQQRLGDKWKPSIHMPRGACRITLEISGVRVERLQNISIEDAKSEGAWGPDESIVSKVAEYFSIDHLGANPYNAYQMLWESINGPGSWSLNPWVWVIEFRRLP